MGFPDYDYLCYKCGSHFSSYATYQYHINNEHKKLKHKGL